MPELIADKADPNYQRRVPTGDSLTILTVFASSSLAAMIGALTAPPGKRATFLWVLCGAFALLTLAQAFTPWQSPLVRDVMSVVGTFATSGAWVMLGTVGIVAMMQPKTRTAAPELGPDPATPSPPLATPTPKFASHRTSTKWTPDVSLSDAFSYFEEHSGERGYYDKKHEVFEKFVTAARESRVTSWAKEHPDDDKFYQIDPKFWNFVTPTFETGFVFSKHVTCGAHCVHFSQAELKAVWPPKAVVTA